jgi:hypothetical protein
MIQDVDETLRRLLVGELSKLPETLISDPSQITFDPPSVAEGASNAKPRLNLYLHDVRENLQMRDDSWALVRKQKEGIAGRKRPPVRLDLSYIITAYAGGDAAKEHTMLSDALAVFLRAPFAPVECLAGSLQGRGPESVLVQVVQPDDVAHSDPHNLWRVLGGHIRPAITVVVTTEFDPFETKWTRVVREAVLGIGQGVPPDGPRRPLDVSSIRVSAAGVTTSSDGQKPMPGVSISVVGREERATSDSRGFWYILDLPPGVKKLRFEKRGYRPVEVETVCPPPGRPDQLEPMVVILEAMADSERAIEEKKLAEAVLNDPSLVELERVYHVSLSGRLRHADGRPAAYVPLRVGRHHTTSDGDGVYTFHDLPPGPHELIADLPGVGEVVVKSMDGTAMLALPEEEAPRAKEEGRRRKEG